MVMGVCRRGLGDWHDAEEAWHAAFLILAGKAGSRRWRGSVANWLYKTAYQVALKARTAAGRRSKHEGRVTGKVSANPLVDITAQELLTALDEELLKLPDRLRAPLVLCYLQGLTRDEATKQLGCPLGTLKGRLEQGRERLQTALTRRGLTLSAGLAAFLLSQAAGEASVPAAVIRHTVQAALLMAAGKSVAGAVSGPVGQLLKGGLGPMTRLTKFKGLMLVLLAAGLLAGAGALAHRVRRPAETLAWATEKPADATEPSQQREQADA